MNGRQGRRGPVAEEMRVQKKEVGRAEENKRGKARNLNATES